MTRRTTKPRASKLDHVVHSTSQEYAHRDTSDILRRHDVLQHEADILDCEAGELRAKLSTNTRKRVTIGAQLRGLNNVVARR